MNLAPEKTKSRTVPTSRRRRWLFRILAVGLGLSVLPVAEVLLRLFSVGTETALVVPLTDASIRKGHPFTHQFNSAADLVFYGPTDLAGPELRPFTLPRPANTFRIVVLGESTVIGFPYAPELAFPRQLQLQLQRQLPGQNIEVLNAGITGINSFALADLATQCLDAQPDLIVLHPGHNEFYGTGGPGSTAFNFPPFVIRAAFTLRHLRSVQLIAGGYGKTVMKDDLFSTLPQQLDIPLNSPVYHQAIANYRSNLLRIMTDCSRAKVPLLLVPVACNLRDQSPMMASWPEKSKKKRGEWKDLMSQASELLEQSRFEEALPILTQATVLVPNHAESQYRLGQCLQALQQVDEAYKAFSTARDLDACRFRMPSEFYHAANALADEHPECHYLDLPAEFRKEGYHSAPGNDLFLEHVHYNFDGHFVVGKVLAKAILNGYLNKPWDPALSADAESARELLGYLTEDELAATSFIIQMMDTAPFAKCLDREIQVQSLISRTKELFEALPEERRTVFADLQFTQMSNDMLLHLNHLHRSKGHDQVCRRLSSCRVLRMPWKTPIE